MAMSWKAMDKILYFIVPMIVLLGIYCGQTSNEISGYFQPYNVKNSSDIMIISVDNSTYKQGQTIQIVGKVNDYNEGGTVQIRIVDPSRNEVSSFSGLLNEFGIFYGSFAIPETFSSGKYLINAYYEGDPNKNLITLKVNISNAPKGVVYISIPFGASTQENKINFDPQTIDIQQGTKIVWINYDNTVHTVISGKINDDGTLSVDGRLKGGFIAPGEKLTIVPANPAKYSYFCKIHPWLEGFVSVKASPDTSKAKVSADTAKPKAGKDTAKPKAGKDTAKPKAGKDTAKPKAGKDTAKPKAGKDNVTLAKAVTDNVTLPKVSADTAKSKAVTDNVTLPKVSADTAKSKASANTATKPKTVNSNSFPVPDNILLTIWKNRKDLQNAYPEVADGNLAKLKSWATTTGWKQDKRLSVLIPKEKGSSHMDTSLKFIWKERKDLQNAYPEVADGNLTKLKSWATTTGWNEDKRLSVLIPQGKVPSYMENVLQSIWGERKDLQKSYPEVAHGKLDKLKKWAITTGWKQDERLSVLIPQGKVPSYMENVLQSIWKERRDLQNAYPEVAHGKLDNLMKWATTTGWKEDKRLSVLIPPGMVPKY